MNLIKKIEDVYHKVSQTIQISENISIHPSFQSQIDSGTKYFKFKGIIIFIF